MSSSSIETQIQCYMLHAHILKVVWDLCECWERFNNLIWHSWCEDIGYYHMKPISFSCSCVQCAVRFKFVLMAHYCRIRVMKSNNTLNKTPINSSAGWLEVQAASWILLDKKGSGYRYADVRPQFIHSGLQQETVTAVVIAELQNIN